MGRTCQVLVFENSIEIESHTIHQRISVGNTRWLKLNPSAVDVTFTQCTKKLKYYGNHLNPVMLVFIGKVSLSTLMC